ncbi:MAG: 30S ribosomal protein S20 [Candidatus Omnitrophica bacterium]|nr:30S ribosomal protein S20 [Candidatus Omnitrophota bacterium]
MPIKRAALRQLRKDRVRNVRNQALRSELKTLKKQLTELLAQKRQEEARTLLPLLTRRFDQAAAKGIIHKNTASRTTGRLMRHLTRGTAPARGRVARPSRSTPPPTPPAPSAEPSVPS